MLLRRSFIILAATVGLLALSSNSFADHLTYFNLEGQAGSGLLPGNEVGGASSSASGGILSEIVFDSNTNVLSIDVGWGSGNGFTDLTGSSTGMHIHGPAGFTSNAGVLYNLGAMGGYNSSATNGGFTGSFAVDAADVQDMLDGLFYINVHSAANPGGELRGNLVQQSAIPEPASAFAVAGLFGLVALRRRRKSN